MKYFMRYHMTVIVRYPMKYVMRYRMKDVISHEIFYEIFFKCHFQKGTYCEQLYFISLAYVQLESNRTSQTIMLTDHNLLSVKYTGCPQKNVPVFVRLWANPSVHIMFCFVVNFCRYTGPMYS